MSPLWSASKRFLISGLLLVSPLLVFGQGTYSPQQGEYPITLGTGGDQTHSRVSLNKTGGYIVWQDNATDGDGLGIGARALDSSFSPILQRTFRVNQLGAGDQANPDVKLLNNGGAVFVWQGGPTGAQNIYARFLKSDGTFATGDILVNTYTNGQQITPVIGTQTDGNLVMVWSSFGQDGSMLGVYGQRFSPAGDKLGGEFQVNQFTSYNQRSPAVAALDNGNFVVVWVSEQQRFENSVDLYARLYNAAGESLGNEFLINNDTNVCANPSVARTDGGFAVAWSKLNVSDPSNAWDVAVRYFNANGSPAGDPARVNTFVSLDQYAPQITSIGQDQLIVWTSLWQDGDREGVYGRFLNGGTLSGDEFRVNTTRVSQQIHPAIGSDSTNLFLVTWSSFVGGAAGFDLFAQRYSSSRSLLPPSPPLVAALDQYRLSVTWPELAGYTNVLRYDLYLDSNSVPILVSNNFCVVDSLMPSSTHTVRLAYELVDNNRSPISNPATGRTWGTDANFDGLPDDWETMYWGSNAANWPSGQSDSDGDGATNLQEFLAGTDPTDANSVLRVQIVTTGQGPRLNWNAQPGFIYQVQVSTDLHTWTNTGTAHFAAGTSDSIPVTQAGDGVYYRVIRMR